MFALIPLSLSMLVVREGERKSFRDDYQLSASFLDFNDEEDDDSLDDVSHDEFEY